MNKNIIYPSLRLDSELSELIQKAIQSLNKNDAGIKIKREDFRRWAYRSLANSILYEGLTLQFNPKHNPTTSLKKKDALD